MKQAAPAPSTQKNPPPVAVDWYPSPKVQQPQLRFAPEPGQPGTGQWGGASAGFQANPAQPSAGVPQNWILVPANGYFTGQTGGTTNLNPAPGTGQQVTPWNVPAPQSRIYRLQQVPQQTYGYPQQPVQPPVQQPYSYQYPVAPPATYVQRPWGEYSGNSTGNSQGASAGQKPAEPPPWGAPGYGYAPAPWFGYNGAYPGLMEPGYVW